jgi:hypothetical protein
MDRWTQVDGVLERGSLGHVVLLAPGRNEPSIANASSAAVWRELADAPTQDDLVARIGVTFGLDAAEAAQGVEQALAELHRAGVAARGR